jgi:hypothetical protein
VLRIRVHSDGKGRLAVMGLVGLSASPRYCGIVFIEVESRCRGRSVESASRARRENKDASMS